MSLSIEDKQEIVGELLLLLPEILGNMYTKLVAEKELRESFIKNHPEFSSELPFVGDFLSKKEAQNPTIPYQELLNSSIAELKEAIKVKRELINADIQ